MFLTASNGKYLNRWTTWQCLCLWDQRQRRESANLFLLFILPHAGQYPSSSSHCRKPQEYLFTLSAVYLRPCDICERTANMHVSFHACYFMPTAMIDGVLYKKQCSERGVESILTHYATVMKAHVQRQMGQHGKERGATATTKYPSVTGDVCQRWSEFNQGKKQVAFNRIRWSFFFFFVFSKATQELLSLAAPPRFSGETQHGAAFWLLLGLCH